MTVTLPNEKRCLFGAHAQLCSADVRNALFKLVSSWKLRQGFIEIITDQLVVIFLQKLRITPDAAFSVNDWTAFVIFIVVIGGIGTIEGPIIGTLIYFALRETLADLGTIYLIVLGFVAIIVMLKAPKGLWGLIRARWGLELFPLSYRVADQ